MAQKLESGPERQTKTPETVSDTGVRFVTLKELTDDEARRISEATVYDEPHQSLPFAELGRPMSPLYAIGQDETGNTAAIKMTVVEGLPHSPHTPVIMVSPILFSYPVAPQEYLAAKLPVTRAMYHAVFNNGAGELRQRIANEGIGPVEPDGKYNKERVESSLTTNPVFCADFPVPLGENLSPELLLCALEARTAGFRAPGLQDAGAALLQTHTSVSVGHEGPSLILNTQAGSLENLYIQSVRVPTQLIHLRTNLCTHLRFNTPQQAKGSLTLIEEHLKKRNRAQTENGNPKLSQWFQVEDVYGLLAADMAAAVGELLLNNFVAIDSQPKNFPEAHRLVLTRRKLD